MRPRCMSRPTVPSTLETSLVLAQAALELIAWVHVVVDERSQTGPEFNTIKWGAAGRIREVLAWLELDPTVPVGLSSLASEALRLGWADGPHAIDYLRNALAHPDKRSRIEDTDVAARIDLQELALWYVELALLKVVGFRGEYSSRLDSHTSGVVVPVPWAKTPAT